MAHEPIAKRHSSWLSTPELHEPIARKRRAFSGSDDSNDDDGLNAVKKKSRRESEGMDVEDLFNKTRHRLSASYWKWKLDDDEKHLKSACKGFGSNLENLHRTPQGFMEKRAGITSPSRTTADIRTSCQLWKDNPWPKECGRCPPYECVSYTSKSIIRSDAMMNVLSFIPYADEQAFTIEKMHDYMMLYEGQSWSEETRHHQIISKIRPVLSQYQ